VLFVLFVLFVLIILLVLVTSRGHVTHTSVVSVLVQYPDEVWMHEIGHNLGMEHAGGDDNNDGIMEDE
jgi:predicted Zn-dependent protease